MGVGEYVLKVIAIHVGTLHAACLLIWSHWSQMVALRAEREGR